MTALLVQIRAPNGTVEQMVVDGERVLIGSGAHCDIRLGMDQAALEHLTLTPTQGGVYVQALSFDPPPTVNGVPFTQGPLPVGAIIHIGSTQLAASITDAAGVTAPKQKQKSSPITVISLIGIIVGGYFLLFGGPQQNEDEAPREAPALFGAAITACPQQGTRDQLLALAREKQLAADSRRERRPFYPQDGVVAVPLYEQVAACYQAAGDPAAAAEASGNAQALRRDIDLEYRTHRLRLEHFLKVGDFPSSQREVRLLRQYTEGAKGDYVAWLENLDRKLKRKLGRPQT